MARKTTPEVEAAVSTIPEMTRGARKEAVDAPGEMIPETRADTGGVTAIAKRRRRSQAQTVSLLHHPLSRNLLSRRSLQRLSLRNHRGARVKMYRGWQLSLRNHRGARVKMCQLSLQGSLKMSQIG